MMSFLRYALLLGGLAVVSRGEGETASRQWTFDQGEAKAGRVGLWSTVPGVKGEAEILDGFTSGWSGTWTTTPAWKEGMTWRGWVACGAYPMHEGPLLDILPKGEDGVALVIDAEGRLLVHGQQAGATFSLMGVKKLPLRAWQLVAVTFAPNGDVRLWLNGEQIGEIRVALAGEWKLGRDWQIGKSRGLERPTGTLREEATAKAPSFIDGALDDWRVVPGLMSPVQLRAEASLGAGLASPLPERVLPAGPAGPGPFGAYATTLRYYPQWDAHWRVGAQADVVVRFEEMAGRLVFWRGTSYIPHWVTENGIWYTNEFNETWGDIMGCGEPMSDKQCRYSRVAILESGPARAVVHWRYALADVFYTVARPDPASGWGDWSDEIYTFYPDGTAVRSVTLHTTDAAAPHEWHEGIVVMGPGWTPERALEPEGLTLIDPAGEETVFSWRDQTPPWSPAKPETVSIHLVNTKSQWRPFTLVRPQDRATFNIFAKEVRRDVSMYPWWNHWPTNMLPSDGRYAYAADRPSHASLSNLHWEPYRQQGTARTKIMLTGLTDRPARELRPLLQSWSNPPVARDGTGPLSYDPEQRAYVGRWPAGAREWSVEVAASPDSPLVRPAWVLRGGGAWRGTVFWNGEKLQEGADFRRQVRPTLEGDDLVLWIKREASSPVSLRLKD